MTAVLKTVLIVGAGPTGLSAAIFLHEHGIKARIIEKLKESEPFSKAFGVNPKTLTLFQTSGVTDRLLANGRKMPAVNIRKDEKVYVKNDLTQVKHQFPFMLVLSQRETECILEGELNRRGIQVEREVEFEKFEIGNGQVKSTIRHRGEKNEVMVTDYVFAADGARSNIRKQLGFEFKGSSYNEEWSLLDVELDFPYDKNEGHVFVQDDGGILFIRIHDNVWRLASNMNNILDRIPGNIRPGNIKWKSKFRVSHRIASSLSNGLIFLGGDAAHIHSPLGARGMNMGIEDAYVFAKLFALDRLGEYEKTRKPVIKRTVRLVNFITQMATGRSSIARLRRKVLPVMGPVLQLFVPAGQKFILDID